MDSSGISKEEQLDLLLPTRSIALLDALAQAAQRYSIVGRSGGLYLVGGLVRDIVHFGQKLQEVPPDLLDVDIAVEGDALQFVDLLSKNWGEDSQSEFQVVSRQKFKKYGTAKVVFSTSLSERNLTVDFARCRAEHYAQPASPPKITAATIAEDLWRRDFSINAMAISLVGENKGQLVDPCGGRADLSAGVLRILHGQSFCDDPVRMLRGIRLKRRFGFSFEPQTSNLIEEAIAQKWLNLVAPYRRFDEFRKAIEENEVVKILTDLLDSKLLQQIHPLLHKAFETQGELIKDLAEFEGAAKRVTAFCSQLSREEREVLSKELMLRKKESAWLLIN